MKKILSMFVVLAFAAEGVLAQAPAPAPRAAEDAYAPVVAANQPAPKVKKAGAKKKHAAAHHAAKKKAGKKTHGRKAGHRIHH